MKYHSLIKANNGLNTPSTNPCKLLDFGAWADENYNLPVESGGLSEEDWEKIERALEEEASPDH